MLTHEKASDSHWAFELARFGASPTVVAVCCGRTRKWAKHLVEVAGGEATRRMPVNRERTFASEPYRKAHAHVVVRLSYGLTGAPRPPERLALIYVAYRSVESPAIFSIDEVHDLVFNVLEEGGAEVRACASCRQQWYSVGDSSPMCPACEARALYVCAKCKGPVQREEGKRGRPATRCDKCRERRPPRRAAAAANDRQLVLLGLTSPDDSVQPTGPRAPRASHCGR